MIVYVTCIMAEQCPCVAGIHGAKELEHGTESCKAESSGLSNMT